MRNVAIDLDYFEDYQDELEEKEGMKGIMRHHSYDDTERPKKRSKSLSRGRQWDSISEE